MTFLPETDHDAASPLAKPEALLRVPMGFASPLWGFFATAAMGGSAWWWMTRWTRTENLEALFGAAAKAQTELAQAPRVLAAPILDAVDTVEVVETEVLAAEEDAIEAAAERVSEAEAATETAVEALADPADVAAEPVGGEAAPISPLVADAAETVEAAAEVPQAAAEAIAEAAPELAPKLRKKTAAPKAD